MSFLPPQFAHLEGVAPIIGIDVGDKPVHAGVIEAAKKHHMEARGWTDIMRDDAMLEPALRAEGWISETPGFDQAMAALSVFENQLLVTHLINNFNAYLHAHRLAATRLERHILSEGRPAIHELQPTGVLDPLLGIPEVDDVLVAPAIEPLPLLIERPVVDAETGKITGVDEVPNPAIVKDEAERAAAQAVVDATPDEVLQWMQTQQQ